MYLRGGVARRVASLVHVRVLQDEAELLLRAEDAGQSREPLLAAVLWGAAEVRHVRTVRVRRLQDESAVLQLVQDHVVDLKKVDV